MHRPKGNAEAPIMTNIILGVCSGLNTYQYHFEVYVRQFLQDLLQDFDFRPGSVTQLHKEGLIAKVRFRIRALEVVLQPIP